MIVSILLLTLFNSCLLAIILLMLSPLVADKIKEGKSCKSNTLK